MKTPKPVRREEKRILKRVRRLNKTFKAFVRSVLKAVQRVRRLPVKEEEVQ